MIANAATVENRQRRWLIWRIVVPALTLLFVVYPAVMPPPPHAGAMGLISLPKSIPVHVQVRGACPPAEVCAVTTVVQALPRLPVPPSLLLALAVVVFAVRWQPRHRAEHHEWWWPPDRRRALLQVFLM